MITVQNHFVKDGIQMINDDFLYMIQNDNEIKINRYLSDEPTAVVPTSIEFIPVDGADHRFVNPTHMSLANKYVMQFFDL